MSKARPPRLVDWSGPLDQVAGNVEVLRGIVAAYAEEIRETLDLLPRTLAEARYADARRQAHTVKGALRMFGVSEGVERGQQLEDAAAAAAERGEGEEGAATARPGCAGLLEPLRQVAEATLPELDAFVETGELPPS